VDSIFIQLYLDEDVSVLVADLLRIRGFDAVTARDMGQLEKSDEEQLAHAVNQSRVLLTHNRADFETLALQYFEREQPHFGIIIAVQRPEHELVERLLIILNNVASDEAHNHLIYI